MDARTQQHMEKRTKCKLLGNVAAGAQAVTIFATGYSFK